MGGELNLCNSRQEDPMERATESEGTRRDGLYFLDVRIIHTGIKCEGLQGHDTEWVEYWNLR